MVVFIMAVLFVESLHSGHPNLPNRLATHPSSSLTSYLSAEFAVIRVIMSRFTVFIAISPRWGQETAVNQGLDVVV